MTIELTRVDLKALPRWKRPMKWDGTRDVIEAMNAGDAFEFTPESAKQLRVLRVMVSDYGNKTGKVFSVKKVSDTNYILARIK